MARRAVLLFILAAAAGLAAYLVAPSGATRAVVWAGCLVGTALAIVVGVRLHRPTIVQPWMLLGVGTATMAISALADTSIWGQTAVPGSAVLASLAILVGYLLVGLGAARFANAQSAGRDHGPMLDSLILTLAFVAVLWEAVLARTSVGSPADREQLIAMLVLTSCSAWVTAMTVRLVLAGAYRVMAGWLLLTSATLGVGGAAMLAWSGMPDQAPPTATMVLWTGALMLLGATALHPTMRTLTVAAEVETAHVITRTVLPATALLLPPATMTISVLQNGRSSLVSVLIELVIAAAVVLRFANLVADRERARDLVRQQASHDALTGLPNRSLFEQRLRRQLERQRHGDSGDVAVLFVDLDGFKAVNDTHGHAAGDELLVGLAARLAEVCRPEDTVARFAGDEFVVALADACLASAERVTERLRQRICEPLEVSDTTVRVDASVGIAMASTVGYDFDRLVSTADDAMYAAKRAGRGRVVVATEPLAVGASAVPAVRHGRR